MFKVPHERAPDELLFNSITCNLWLNVLAGTLWEQSWIPWCRLMGASLLVEIMIVTLRFHGV